MKPTATRFRVGSGGVLYLLVSVLLTAAAIYTQANLLFWGVGLMVGGAVVSAGCAAVALRGLDVSRVVAHHTAAGEPTSIRYQMTQRAWVPAFGLVIRENWGRGAHGWKKTGPAAGPGAILGGPPHAWVLHLPARDQHQAQAPCLPLHRGTLHFERFEVSTSFPFSLIHKVVIFPQPDTVTVFPPLFRVRRRLLAGLTPVTGDGPRSVDRAGGGEEFFGVRAYRPGDPPRMIDWKRTARTGDLAARELTQPSPPTLTVVLDLRNAPPTVVGGRKRKSRKAQPAGNLVAPAAGRQLEERAISLAASVVCDGYLLGYRVGLQVLGPPCPTFKPAHNLPHRTRLLEALAQLDLSQRHAGPAAPAPPRADPDAPAAHRPAHSAGPDQADLLIWAGRGTGLPKPSAFGRPSTTVLGAADFDQYVTESATLDDLQSAPVARTPAAMSSA